MVAQQKTRKKGVRYVRLATYPVEEVLPFVFTKEVRKALSVAGFGYESEEWKKAASHKFWYTRTNRIVVPMGSHRYQLYAEKGCTCVRCGLKGTYFALERGLNDVHGVYHLNLYAALPGGGERMLTKDHIIPRSKGGRNHLDNYQPMCSRCNQKKSNKLEVAGA